MVLNFRTEDIVAGLPRHGREVFKYSECGIRCNEKNDWRPSDSAPHHGETPFRVSVWREVRTADQGWEPRSGEAWGWTLWGPHHSTWSSLSAGFDGQKARRRWHTVRPSWHTAPPTGWHTALAYCAAKLEAAAELVAKRHEEERKKTLENASAGLSPKKAASEKTVIPDIRKASAASERPASSSAWKSPPNTSQVANDC